MKLTAWRITLARYAEAAFDGEGARRYGGRFNRPGTPVVYAASTLALAMLAQHVVQSVTFDAEDVLVLEWEALPPGWNAPVPPPAVQEVGTRWAASKASLFLRVPSVLIPDEAFEQEHNYLINPLHPRASELEIGPARALAFDERFFK